MTDRSFVKHVKPELLNLLQRPGTLAFPSNQSFLSDPAATDVRAVRLSSGHLVFYGPHDRRILATDPDGNPLHECDWTGTEPGGVALVRARLRLDWGQWVGLRPGGMVQSTRLNLSSRPGWQRLKADDLRQMAAQAMRVPLEEVQFFYPDEDLTIDGEGQATIRHRKDAFYVLEDGTFSRPRFMACMGAMHWGRIDFLPVVELFQSLLPGTGSAAFELIRGLYDDQNTSDPRPLRYRGIPTYPSPAAYRLFSAFFTPGLAKGGDPFPVFMDPARSREVAWLPAPAPPRRYFDEPRKLCVTIKADAVQKVTRADDPAGLPYVEASASTPPPCDRRVTVAGATLELRDGEACIEVPVNPAWGPLRESPPTRGPALAPGWRALLGEGFTPVSPQAAYSAVLLYPEERAEIDELACQPFAADHLQDLFEQEPPLRAHLGRSRRVLVDNFDARLSALVHLDAPRDVSILYRHAAFVQKFAQSAWNALVQRNRLDWVKHIHCLPERSGRAAAYRERYDLILSWVPFAIFDQEAGIDAAARQAARSLRPGGIVCLVGPAAIGAALQAEGLQMLGVTPVEELPTYRMHLTLLPQSRLKPGLTLFLARA